ncbi:hypothetical protein B0H12DRAFT_1235078 [Mycena haematopus]|nr:hypothetical protein B0H12DRAFT_1235078 [Mycena haematopus]
MSPALTTAAPFRVAPASVPRRNLLTNRSRRRLDNSLALRKYAQVYSSPNGHYALEARSSTPAYHPPTYERWPTEAGGALSTAVMPAYSTGLVDERHRTPPPHPGDARFGQPLQQPRQYWNEYAAFPPLGYGELHDPALAVHGEPQQIYPLPGFGLYPQNQ